MPANLENSPVAPGLKKVIFISIPKGNAKECSNYCTVAFISHINRVMLQTFQARLQQDMNREFPDVQAGFRKGKGTRDQIASVHCIVEKAREFQKNIYFCFIDYSKDFDCGSQQTVEHSTRDENSKSVYLTPDELVYRSRSNN